jgi:predicted enzyme related to lactoylglutathione lyase
MANIDKHAPGSFCWIELATSDQNAAKKFYTALFGWAVQDMPMGPSDFYSMFSLQGRHTGAAYTMRPDQRAQGMPPNWLLYVATQNADESANRATQAGGTVHAPPFDVFDVGRMSVIQDPTGAVFAVWQAKSHAGIGIAGVDGTFCWADLNTPDAERAKRFYSDVFGWHIALGEHDTSGYLHIKNGDQFIGGIPPAAHRNPSAPPHWLIYFLASDCDAATAKATGLGAKVLMPAKTLENVGRWSIVADPQGAVFAIFQPIQHG